MVFYSLYLFRVTFASPPQQLLTQNLLPHPLSDAGGRFCYLSSRWRVFRYREGDFVRGGRFCTPSPAPPGKTQTVPPSRDISTLQRQIHPPEQFLGQSVPGPVRRRKRRDRATHELGEGEDEMPTHTTGQGLRVRGHSKTAIRQQISDVYPDLTIRPRAITATYLATACG